MGMIMKDGIPYGGIYPIDDAPTQGSNNAVKSGGVHSALSNKVDKVAGKGLSTNDYDNTEKEQNEANAEAIEATQDMISDAYDSTHTYNKGEYCIHENILYRCNTASTTGTWDSSKWRIAHIDDEFLPCPDYPGTLVLTIPTSSIGESYRPQRNGYLCMVYPVKEAGTHIYGNIRAGDYTQYGLTFDMDTKAWASEPVFTLPVRANVSYVIYIEGHIDDMSVYLF